MPTFSRIRASGAAGKCPLISVISSAEISTIQSQTAVLGFRSPVRARPSASQGRSTYVSEDDTKDELLIATATSVLSSSWRALGSEMMTNGRGLDWPRSPGATARTMVPRSSLSSLAHNDSDYSLSGSKGSSSASHHEAGGPELDLRAQSRRLALSGIGFRYVGLVTDVRCHWSIVAGQSNRCSFPQSGNSGSRVIRGKSSMRVATVACVSIVSLLRDRLGLVLSQ